MLGPPDGCEIVEVKPGAWDSALEQSIMNLESVFPPELMDPPSYLKSISEQQNAIFLVAKMEGKIVGYIVGGELERFGDISGVKEDAHFGIGDTVYAESIAVLPDYQGKGIGRHLLRAFLLRAHRKKFRYVAAHAPEGYAEKWGGTLFRQVGNYYGSNRTYEYFRREIRSGSWLEGCRSLMTVQAILSGFSATVLAVLFSVHLPGFGYPAIAFVIIALTLFIYSAEKSTDALDQLNPNVYVNSLVVYNFAVTFFLVGVSLSVLAYGLFYWSEITSSSIYLASILLGVFIPIIASLHWFIDGFWLLRRTNRLSLPSALELSEGQ